MYFLWMIRVYRFTFEFEIDIKINWFIVRDVIPWIFYVMYIYVIVIVSELQITTYW